MNKTKSQGGIKMNKEKALIVFSGGQDSTFCLAWAIEKWGKENIFAITFDYGQKHRIEIDCALGLCMKLGIPNHLHKTDILEWNRNALTDSSIEIKSVNGSVPTSFVPYRNPYFLLVASIFARMNKIKNIVTGVCQMDYSGYKDCRDTFIKAFNVMINQADDNDLVIHTPLMFITKAEMVKDMKRLNKIDWWKDRHTCYEGKRPACGKCPACKLRLKGFQEAGIDDPTEYEVQ